MVEGGKATGVQLTGEGGLLTGLVRQVLQGALELEITDHLGYERHAVEGWGSGSSRKMKCSKTVRTEISELEVKIPRDRNGSFSSRSPAGRAAAPVGTGSDGDLAVRLSLDPPIWFGVEICASVESASRTGRMTVLYIVMSPDPEGTFCDHSLAQHRPDRRGLR